MNSSTILTSRIEELFTKKSSSSMDMILEVVNLLVYNDSTSSDMVQLYNLLGSKTFIKLVTFLDGKSIKLPSKEEIESNLVTALIYYDRKMLGLSWKEIKKKYHELDINSIKVSLRIRKLDRFVQQRVFELLAKIKDNTDE